MKEKDVRCPHGEVIIPNKYDLPDLTDQRHKMEELANMLCLTHCRTACAMLTNKSAAYLRALNQLDLDTKLPL